MSALTITGPERAGQMAAVAGCLARTWTFLMGETVSFDYSEAGCEHGRWRQEQHYLVTLHPDQAAWRAGVIVGLSPAVAARVANTGKEICNIFSGCLTPLFSNREEFVVGLPVDLDTDAMQHILDSATAACCYVSTDRRVHVLAYEIETGDTPAETAPLRSRTA